MLIRFASLALTLLALAAPGLQAQTKCPPLPEGTTCDHFHYHVLVWQPADRTYQEVAGTRQFASLDACEKAKTEAAKENQSIADYMKVNVDSAFQADHYGDCHCDRTLEPSSGAFLDAAARLAQMRVVDEAAWTIRERLLASDKPRASEFVQLLFGREPHLDRFLRETVPARLPEKSVPPPAATLADTTIGAPAPAPTIAAGLTFVEITPPPGAAPQPAATAAAPAVIAAATPAAPPAAAPPPATPVDADPASNFFTYELTRADAILTAADKISEPDVRNVVREEVARRKHVLENLHTVARACSSDSTALRVLRNANDDPARLAVVRKLFGDDVAPAWAPSDARGAATTHAYPADVQPAIVFNASADLPVRRGALFGVLGQDHQLSPEEAAPFAKVVEELLSK